MFFQPSPTSPIDRGGLPEKAEARANPTAVAELPLRNRLRENKLRLWLCEAVQPYTRRGKETKFPFRIIKNCNYLNIYKQVKQNSTKIQKKTC